MKTLITVSALALSLSLPAAAQTSQPSSVPSKTVTQTEQQSAAGLWRSTKMHGINVYNDQNQKIGDIDDVLMDKDGKAKLAVLSVGGFLGMGDHKVAVNFTDLKFSDQPIKSSTTGSNNSTNSSVGKNYPDHAVFNTTKDQLKAMPQFKYGQ